MPSLHLLNQEGPKFPQPCGSSQGGMESGWWRVSEARALSVVGHPIHFHRRKAEPAFLSGIVTGFKREPYTTAKDITSPRTVFQFTLRQDDPATTDSSGWTLAGVKYIS